MFLLDNLHILSIDEVMKFWPVIPIALGLYLLVDRTVWHGGIGRNASFEYASATTAEHRIRESAVFGGGKRRINSQNFTGGRMEAVFSGFEMDLREASMQGDSAVLHIDVVFGGTEVRIPETWSAVVQGTGVFGAFADHTRQPDLSRTPNPKRLIVKGSAVFGGVEVKN